MGSKRIRVSRDREDPQKDPFSTSRSSPETTCSHPGCFYGMCMCCGELLEEDYDVTFGYGLRLSTNEIARLWNQNTKNLLRNQKLYLILDLDHTLLNSTPLTNITPEEEHVRGRRDVYEGSLFVLEHMHTMTKLRPFVRTFLKKDSEMFEMYIHTMGDRLYAHEMAKLLDPNREYFGSTTHQKGLDVVLGQESCVLILDDTEKAWTKHKDNLILIDRYHFFASSCRQFGLLCKSLFQFEIDESEGDGTLATVIGELEDKLAGRNVTRVLKTLRMEVLGGCKIVFSHISPPPTISICGRWRSSWEAHAQWTSTIR
ncbi:hypothetical protein ACJRO7_018964 [Eucalyptus globulus]|uniref:RNA polymerase II C-terminal domain phosphatase-like n=1 Tax=Eucalyptus globulus TaxID=34317 RepID=A0ABD3KWH6_EUCGL